MYLHKSELEAGVVKLMRAMEGSDALEMCEKVLREIGTLGDGDVKDFVRESGDVVEIFVRGLRGGRQVPTLVIDFVYTFLVNDLLSPHNVQEVIGAISEGSWCEASKMKILQMSYYLMRYDNFHGGLSLALFRSIVRMVDDKNKQIQTTAKPIAMHLVDAAFSRACHGLPDKAHSDEEGCDAAEARCELAVGRDGRPLSERLPLRTELGPASPIDEGISLLRHLLQSSAGSREMSHFVVDVVGLVTQKDELFGYEEFRKMYGAEVMAVLSSLVRRGCSSKGGVYKVLVRIGQRHGQEFEKQIREMFEEIEKSYEALDGAEMKMFLDFFGGLDATVFNAHGAAIRRIFFRIVERASLDGVVGREDVIGAIEASLCSQLKAQEKAVGKRHPSTKVFFDKFSKVMHGKLSETCNAHRDVEGLLGIVLGFYAEAGDREQLERFMDLGARIGFSGAVCRSAVENRKHVQESWGVVLRGCKSHGGTILESISAFDAEEVFFLVKAVEGLSLSDGWGGRDKVDFLVSVFNILKPIVVEPLNIRIFEMILEGIANEGGADAGHGTKVFCSVVVDYAGQVEALTPDVERVVFGLLRRVLARDAESGGQEVLETLSEVLRLVTPEESWDTVLECIECACIPRLYSGLYPIVRWIVEGPGHLMESRHFETLMDCLLAMCMSPNSETSLRSVLVFQDVGECLMSRRASGMDSRGGRQAMDGAWVRYIDVLREVCGDGRSGLRDTAIKCLVMFFEAGAGAMSTEEFDFAACRGLGTVLERGKQLVGSSAREAHCTMALMVEECSRAIERTRYHEELCGRFLELAVDGICSSESCEVQGACIEGLRMMAKKASETEGEWQEGSDHSSDDAGFKTGVGDGKGSQCGVGARRLVLNAFRTILSRIPLDEERLGGMCLEVMELMQRQRLGVAEQRALIPLLRKVVHSSNKALQEKAIEMVRLWGDGGPGLDVQLEAYGSWVSLEDMRLARMLIEEIGKALGRGADEGRYCEAAMELVEYCKEEALWEDVVRAFTRASESVRTRGAFVSFVNGSRVILEESSRISRDGGSGEPEGVERAVAAAKRRERIVLEFLGFYHGMVSRFGGRACGKASHEAQPFEQGTEEDVREGYRIVVEMSDVGSGLGKESVWFKCYEILFQELETVYGDVVEKVRRVLGEYNELEAIYNGLHPRARQREVYTVLERMWRSGNKKLVHEVRDVLVECLRSKDYRVIDHVRRCLAVIL